MEDVGRVEWIRSAAREPIHAPRVLLWEQTRLSFIKYVPLHGKTISVAPCDAMVDSMDLVYKRVCVFIWHV